MDDFADLRQRIRKFVARRDWEQFHSPKNLSMALLVEAAELLERFQWMTEVQSSSLTTAQRSAVADEMADVLIYLLLLADRLSIDLPESARKKISRNARRYPVAKARGRATKADRLRSSKRQKA